MSSFDLNRPVKYIFFVSIMNFILQQGKKLFSKSVRTLVLLIVGNRSFLILIKAVVKHLQVFLFRISTFGKLAYISVPLYILL